MTDIEQQKEDMRTLKTVVPVLVKKIDEVNAAFHGLDQVASALYHAMDDARQEVQGQLTTALKEALSTLVTQAEAEEKQLKDADTALIDAWHEATPRFTREGEELVKQTDDVVAHAHDLQAALFDAGTKLDHTQAVGEAALARLEHDVHDAGQRIQAALEALKEHTDQFKQYTEEANTALSAAAQQLVSTLDAASKQAETSMHDVHEDMVAKSKSHEDWVHDVFTALGETLTEKMNQVDAEIEHATTGPLGEAEAHARDDLHKLQTSAGQHEKELEQHGTSLEAALGHVKEQGAAVPAGVAEIAEAAHKLGI